MLTSFIYCGLNASSINEEDIFLSNQGCCDYNNGVFLPYSDECVEELITEEKDSSGYLAVLFAVIPSANPFIMPERIEEILGIPYWMLR